MSASDLKQRGWTNELIRKLLPTPANIRIKGRTVRLWLRADVFTAEKLPEFDEGRTVTSGKPAPGARHTVRMLEQAWVDRNAAEDSPI